MKAHGVIEGAHNMGLHQCLGSASIACGNDFNQTVMLLITRRGRPTIRIVLLVSISAAPRLGLVAVCKGGCRDRC